MTTIQQFYNLLPISETSDFVFLLSNVGDWFYELGYTCPQPENAEILRSQDKITFKLVKEREFFPGELRMGFAGARKLWVIGSVCYEGVPFMIVRNPYALATSPDFYPTRILTDKVLYKRALLYIQRILVHSVQIPTNREHITDFIHTAFDSLPKNMELVSLDSAHVVSDAEAEAAIDFSLSLK